MRTITTTAELQHQVRTSRMRDERIGLVPVLSALHESDVERIRTARAQCGFVVTCVVPRDLARRLFTHHARMQELPERQQALASAGGTDLLWLPSRDDLDADTGATSVHVASQAPWNTHEHDLARSLLATRMVRVINAARADVMYLDETDIDETVMLERVVRDLALRVEVRRVPPLRTPEGVPLGGIVASLEPEVHVHASVLPQALQLAAHAVQEGTTTTVGRLRAQVEMALADEASIDVEFVELVDPATLAPLETLAAPSLLVASVFIDGARIVDHIDVVPLIHR